MKNKNCKSFPLLLIVILIALNGNSQNTLGKTEDLGRIALAAYVPQQIEKMPEGARTMLSNKLNQIVTQNGLGSSSFNSRFIITANIVVLTKDLLETAPPMTALTMEVTLYIGDGISGTKYASNAISVKGVGTNENKAYIEALKSIKPSESSIQSFINTGKSKIIEYYNYKCDVIIKEAQTLEEQNKYEEAIATLTAVPEICKDCFDKSMTAVGPIYKKYMDRQCRVKLAEAKNAWAASQNSSGAAQVAEVLSTIDPDAACYKEAIALSNAVSKKILELEKRDWNFKMKVNDQSVSLKKQRIAAYRDVGVAFGNGQPKSITYNVHGWW